MQRILIFSAVIFVTGIFIPLPVIRADTMMSAIPTTVPQKVRVPALAFDEKNIVLVWNKPDEYAKIKDYTVYMSGKLVGNAAANNDSVSPAKPYINKFYNDDKNNFHVKISVHSFVVTNLKPDTEYSFTVRAVFTDGKESADSSPVRQRTSALPKIFNVKDFGAMGDGSTINTKAIQNAIEACTPYGKVVIPSGVFKTGALFLKSRMTLEIQEGATLLGSDRAEDYPLKKGYRLYPYSANDRPPSLINALSQNAHDTFTDIRIVGKGIIDGNGWKRTDQGSITDETGKSLPQYIAGNNRKVFESGILAKAQMDAVVKEGLDAKAMYGQRRSSLITLRGVRNVYYGDVTCVNPAFHGIMNLECENVVLNGLIFKTFDTNNGDGVEFGNCDNVMVFNSFFDTGDDCINFAAGTGIDAEKQRPMQNAFLFNNYFREGHGAVAIGSHTGAWIQNILAEDNVINGTETGLRCKSNTINGGGARYVYFRDTALKNIVRQTYVFTLDYADSNAVLDYKPSKVPGKFKDISVSGNTVEGTRGSSPVIEVKGDQGSNAYHENIVFENVICLDVNNAQIEGLKKGLFRNVEFRNLKSGNVPWVIVKSQELKFEGTTPKP
jgi:exo-poly-alpha-galacturonosidase